MAKSETLVPRFTVTSSPFIEIYVVVVSFVVGIVALVE